MQSSPASGASLDLTLEDFSANRPPEIRSINGFPIDWRRQELASGKQVWVPDHISYNSEFCGWRVFLATDDTDVSRWVPFDASNDLKGLLSAWQILVSVAQKSTSPWEVDRRANSPGRRGKWDTGVTGVALTYDKTDTAYPGVSIQVIPAWKGQKRLTAGRVTLRRYHKDREKELERFNQAFRDAVALRRRYREHRKANDPSQPLPELTNWYYQDLPHNPLDLDEIMADLDERSRPFRPPDPQAIPPSGDFQKPRAPMLINGFRVEFHPTEMFGERLYLPRHLFRSAGRWMLQFAHVDGTVTQAVFDSGEDPLRSLDRAWEQLCHLYEAHQSTSMLDDRPRIPGNPRSKLGDTGVTGVNVNASYSRKDDSAAVRVNVYQAVLTDSGKSKSTAVFVGGITLNRYLSGEGGIYATFRQLIMRAVALRRYYNHLRLTQGQLTEVVRLADIPEIYFNGTLPRLPDLDALMEEAARKRRESS